MTTNNIFEVVSRLKKKSEYLTKFINIFKKLFL